MSFKRKLVLIPATLLLLFLIGLAVFLNTSPKPPPRILPNPNGYDDFLKATNHLANLPDPAGYDSLSTAQLKQLLSSNAPALQLIRSGIAKECIVPFEYSDEYIRLHFRDLLAFKQIATLLRRDGKVAELEGRTNEAAKTYFTTMQFGQKSSARGIIIDRLIGVAIEAIGLTDLQKLTNSLSVEECQAMARSLERFDADTTPIAETLDTELLWVGHTYPWHVTLRAQLAALFTQKAKSQKQSFTTKLQNHQRSIRLTTLALAARAYELEKGHSPKSTADLVPGYLRAAPKDPATGQALSYP